ncbi:MAG: undecaprenyl-diphosphatase UppP [Chloroflexi bacterium]|nr:undecaprenyl-diphosphatase UppP [Chloroflexota bacterium]
MSVLQVLVLGILQGLTEFLPISSSGHLVLVPWLLGWPNPSITMDLVLHFGTVVAIIAAFWRDLLAIVTGWFKAVFLRQPNQNGRMGWLLILATVPAAVLGFLLNDWFETLFGTPLLVACLLIVTAVLLMVCGRLGKRERSLAQLTWRDALAMGVAQGLAIAPGISRSGATISMGLVRGLDRPSAARFSFLMAIPIIVGAAAYKLLKEPIASSEAMSLVVGFLASAVTGYIVIRLFLRFLTKHGLYPFAIYCVVFALLNLAVYCIRG